MCVARIDFKIAEKSRRRESGSQSRQQNGTLAQFSQIIAEEFDALAATAGDNPRQEAASTVLLGRFDEFQQPATVISRKRIGCSLESGQDSFGRTCLDGYQLANVPRALNSPCETHVERVGTCRKRSLETFENPLLPPDRTISRDSISILQCVI